MRRNRCDRTKIERLLLAIGIHGPSVIYQHAEELTELYRNERSSFMEVQAYLEQHGMSREDVWRLVGEHPEACACWTCIGRLQLQIMRHQAEMAVRMQTEEMEVDSAA